MKLKNLLFATCFAGLVFASCNSDDECTTGTGSNEKYVSFTGTIEKPLKSVMTKASGTTWGSGDAIGVYMKTAGGSIPADIVSDNENVKYTTPGSGQFTAATTGINFPSGAGNVDFIAYYPYKAIISGYTYPVDVADQSSLPAIDLLYSNNATDASQTTSSVALNFKHKLSQLILNITAGSGVSDFTGLGISVEGLKTDGSMSIADGTVAAGSMTATLTPDVVSISNTTAASNSILVPGQNLNAATVKFTIAGKTYEWTPGSKLLESGKKYTYNIELRATGAIALNPSGTIEDWDEGNTGGSNITLTPNTDGSFQADKTDVNLVAAASASDAIVLTADASEEWTASSGESWLTVSPASGTGTGNITLTAEQNTTSTSRSATVTITPTSASLSAITINVTQQPTAATSKTLFPGSDFEDWNAFIGALNQYGVSNGEQSTTGGRNGSGALYIHKTADANAFSFTALVPAGFTAPSKISFYIKGTATGGKSLSMNVYNATGGAGIGAYYSFNLGDCTSDVTLYSSASNNYSGSIDTGGNWVKVTLDLAGLDVNTSPSANNGNLFAIKLGKSGVYDLYIDDIIAE